MEYVMGTICLFMPTFLLFCVQLQQQEAAQLTVRT